MFVLARREGEEIRIADKIVVKVLSVTGKIVRLGFEAPDGVRIERLVNETNVEKTKSNQEIDNGT